MGRYLFRLPDVGEGVTEAEIVAWHVKAGDRVREDDNLADVMTDKATVEMTSPVDGTVIAVNGEIGAMAPVGSVLVELEVEGEGNAGEAGASEGPVPKALADEDGADQPGDVAADPLAEATASPLDGSAPQRSVRSKATGSAPATSGRGGAGETRGAMPGTVGREQVFAAPATRKRAYELGIPLQFVPGTGPGGRILPADLDAFIAAGGVARTPGGTGRRTGVTDKPIIGLRRKIAERMQEAKRRIPHISYVEEIDVTELEALRATVNEGRGEGQPKLTLLPFLIRALVRVLPDFPQINALYDDEADVLHMQEGVHVGIATQTPGGLMVPVLRHAEGLDVWEIAREITRLSQAARDGSATREELSGSTITITSLGPLGGIATTPVINRPEVAIIGPNRIVERPVVAGQFISVRKLMNVSSSFDHRIVDGYDAALFIQALKQCLEHPALIFMGNGA